MFCPKCGIGNHVDQKFCRGCGHALAGHKVAARKQLRRYGREDQERFDGIRSEHGTLIVMSLMTLGVCISQKDAGVFVTLFPALGIAIPGAILGLVRLNRAYRALSATDRGNRKAVEQSKAVAIHLAPGATTDPLVQSAQTPASVTEKTTLDLVSPEELPGEYHEPVMGEARAKLPS